MELVRDTYRYRQLIWALALKELKIRYKRSVLGFLWALLNLALMMLVLTLVFSTIMQFAIKVAVLKLVFPIAAVVSNNQQPAPIADSTGDF